jgi:tRNA dimethylallyltransferase
MTQKKQLFAIALTGPTASGKTALSIGLAKELGCEIISCDSQQIYKGMDIGTAKVTAQEAEGIPHYLTDVVYPDETFSAMQYKEAVMPIVLDITKRGKIPLFVGGTGLYLETACRGTSPEAPESDPEYRKVALEKIKSEEDKIALYERLRQIDPESAEATHHNNVKRVIRALEIYDKTGIKKSDFDKASRSVPPDIRLVHVTLDFHNRDNLYERINKRVDIMMRQGLEKEVDMLLAKGYLTADSTAGGAIGYKEIIEGRLLGLSSNEIADNIKLASRWYAKRQLTWFRHREGAFPLYLDSEDGHMRSTDELLSSLIATVKEALSAQKDN